MRITVTLYGELKRAWPPGRGEVDAPDGVTVAELLTQLGVTSDHPRIVAVNDETVDEDTVLADGDHLEVFHAVAGGRPLTLFSPPSRYRLTPTAASPFSHKGRGVRLSCLRNEAGRL